MRPWTLVVALLLTGCAAPAEPAVDANASEPTPSASFVASPPGLEVARYADVEPVDVTLWFNGTFRLEEASRPPRVPGGFAPSPAAAWRTFDLAPHVPVGVPSVLVAQVDAPLAHGDLDLWYRVPDEDFRNGGACSPRGGFTRVEPGVVHSHGGEVTLNVFYDEAEPQQEITYTLFAQVRSDPAVTPGGMAVGLTVPEGTTSVVVETVGARRDCLFDLDTPNLMVWGADDAFLGHRDVPEGRLTVPLADGEGGEYVLMLSQGGRGLRIHAPPGSSLRPMGQEFVVGEPRRGSDTKMIEWSVDVPRVPTLAGVMFATPTVARDVEIRYASPSATLIEDVIQGGPWLNGNLPGGVGPSGGFWVDSAFGVPGLDAGTYTGRVAFAQGAGAEPLWVSDLVAHWVR